MKINAEELTVNGITYVPKDSVQSKLKNSLDGLQCVVIRTYSAGVFYGYLSKKDGQEVELLNAKRIWVWYGAASLSQLSVDGVSRPTECKIPVAVPSITLLQVIEIIPLSEKAFNSLESVPVWKA
jgi:hypothetical protein